MAEWSPQFQASKALVITSSRAYLQMSHLRLDLAVPPPPPVGSMGWMDGWSDGWMNGLDCDNTTGQRSATQDPRCDHMHLISCLSARPSIYNKRWMFSCRLRTFFLFLISVLWLSLNSTLTPAQNSQPSSAHSPKAEPCPLSPPSLVILQQ